MPSLLHAKTTLLLLLLDPPHGDTPLGQVDCACGPNCAPVNGAPDDVGNCNPRASAAASTELLGVFLCHRGQQLSWA